MTMGFVALGNKLNAKATDKERVKLCLFLIDNALQHSRNDKTILAGIFASGYLSSLLVSHNLNSWD